MLNCEVDGAASAASPLRRALFAALCPRSLSRRLQRGS